MNSSRSAWLISPVIRNAPVWECRCASIPQIGWHLKVFSPTASGREPAVLFRCATIFFVTELSITRILSNKRLFGIISWMSSWHSSTPDGWQLFGVRSKLFVYACSRNLCLFLLPVRTNDSWLFNRITFGDEVYYFERGIYSYTVYCFFLLLGGRFA